MKTLCRRSGLAMLALLTFLLAGSRAASPEPAPRHFFIDAGYVATSSSNYSSGLIYGGGITEGKGRFGFGLSGQRFTNSVGHETAVKIDGVPQVFKWREQFSDFSVTIMGTLNMETASRTWRLAAGMGPQVHFVGSARQFITGTYEQTARESRLGLGVFLLYQRTIRAFGQTALVLTATYSWMESGTTAIDVYTPPPESVSMMAFSAGVAFPF